MPIDVDNDPAISRFLDETVRRLEWTGAAVLVIDHTGNNDSSRFKPAMRPAGSHRKMDDVDGAAWAIHLVEMTDDGRDAKRIRMVTRKDNQFHAVDRPLLDLVLEPGTFRWELPATARATTTTSAEGAAAGVDRVHAFITAHPGCALGALETKEAKHSFRMRTDDIRAARKWLADNGYVSVTEDGRAKRLTALKAYP